MRALDIAHQMALGGALALYALEFFRGVETTSEVLLLLIVGFAALLVKSLIDKRSKARANG